MIEYSLGKTGPATNRPVACFFLVGISLRCVAQESNNDGNQCSALYKGSHEDHVCTDVTHSFWLAGNGFHCLATNLADADAGADDCQAHSDSGN